MFVRLEAKPGKEEAVAAFLMQGLQLANQETATPVWFALRLGPTTFAIFDAFHDEAGRQSHLNGPIAKALMAQAPNLLAHRRSSSASMSSAPSCPPDRRGKNSRPRATARPEPNRGAP